MDILISISRSRAVDKFRVEKMFNLIGKILEGEPIEIEGSPFVACAKYVYEAQDMDLLFVVLGEDENPITPSRCIVLDDMENIVFDPDEKFRSEQRESITEPMYYKLDQNDTRRSRDIPYYIVSRRRARELL